LGEKGGGEKEGEKERKVTSHVGGLFGAEGFGTGRRGCLRESRRITRIQLRSCNTILPFPGDGRLGVERADGRVCQRITTTSTVR
jgi:hypothetical protein